MQSFAEHQRWTEFESREINPLVNYESGTSVNRLLKKLGQAVRQCQELMPIVFLQGQAKKN